MLTKLLQNILLVLVSVIITCFVVKMITPNPPKMVSLDMSKIIKAFAYKSAALNLSDTEQAGRSKLFASTLTQISEAYSKDNGVIILVNGAVVSGVEDVTPLIAEQVLK
jgi:type-F conjugative transfer system protein TrbI